MNKKQREVIENLITYTKRFTDSDDAHYDWESRKRALATIAAAEKLLNPLVWVRVSNRRMKRCRYEHKAPTGVKYSVDRSPLGWIARIKGGRSIGGRNRTYYSLAAAKRACIDYGVAHTRAETKAAQIHTDPAIRAILTPPTQKG